MELKKNSKLKPSLKSRYQKFPRVLGCLAVLALVASRNLNINPASLKSWVNSSFAAFESSHTELSSGRSPEEILSIQRIASETSEWDESDANESRHFPVAPQVVEIPVYFHVFYTAQGEGLNGKRADGSLYLIGDRIKDQVSELNRAFSSPSSSSSSDKGIDSRIRFHLLGVEYVQDEVAFRDCNPDYVMKGRAINPDRVVNIYTCSIFAIGMSAMPGSLYCQSTNSYNISQCSQIAVAPRESYIYGIRLDSSVLPGGNRRGLTQGRVLVHEMGHFFGLLHPFQDSCSSQLPSDFISDTPRIKSFLSGACPQEAAPMPKNLLCPQDQKRFKQNDYYGNYMVSTFDKCRSHFTKEQVLFMQTSLTIHKNFL